MNKLKPIEDVERLRWTAAKLGRRVVFTNGCFDILHVGHIRTLSDAKKLGDVLIVGINSDESLKSLKGLKNPVTSQEERAEILSSLSCVDHVVVFDSSTADDIISRLRPDIHAKGTDYTEESVPERATVLAYGGKIAITGDPKSHSTKEIIKKIRTEI